MIQYFLRSFRGTVTWAKCRFRHKIGTEFQKTSQYQPNKGHEKHFTVPVKDQSVSISAGLVPGPTLCPVTAERPQETLYLMIIITPRNGQERSKTITGWRRNKNAIFTI
jgi:hypothetical protein